MNWINIIEIVFMVAVVVVLFDLNSRLREIQLIALKRFGDPSNDD